MIYILMQNKIPESSYYPDGVFKDFDFALVHLDHSNIHENLIFAFDDDQREGECKRQFYGSR